MLFKKFFNNVREIEVDLAWCHWNRLGVSGSGKIATCSTDPEALIILTSIVGRYDLRLVEVMNEWLGNYESLVSIERLKRYIKEVQTEKNLQGSVFSLLRDALSHVDAKRWQPVSDLLGGGRSGEGSAKKRNPLRKKLEEHDKIVKANRQLFLRLLFGVGSRADVIYYAGVVGNQEKNPFNLQISAPHITRMLHYNNSSIFRTLRDLEQAGVFMTDVKMLSGKNKVYLPSVQLKGSKDIFGDGRSGEKAFIDWFPVAKICLLIEALESGLEGVREESIVKSRLSDFITTCAALTNDACIDAGDSLSAKALYPALVNVGLDELQSKIISQIEGVYEFVSS